MSNPRKKTTYDSTLTNPWEIDANNNGPVVLYDASGDPILTAANPGIIEATDLDIRALDPAIDEVVVQATELDIRDLTSASDSVEAIQDTAADLNATVVATDLDIRALDPSIDTVSIGDSDGTEVDVVSEGGVGKINITDENILSLLTGIHKELMKLNLQMSFLTDNYITNKEVE